MNQVAQHDAHATRGHGPPLVQIRGLSKSYGGIPALQGVDLDVVPGEVHGLVGANGAGKSTLIRVLAGATQPDTGEIRVDGQVVSLGSPQESTRLGLSFIHQELNLVPKFNALQNITLGLPKPSRGGLIDWRAVRAQVDRVVHTLGLSAPLSTPVKQLSVVDQWLVSIARALVRDARLIAMDEPTASLSAGESERLFKIVRDLSAAGIAVLYVSHRLDEVLALCGQITVFKDGRRTLDVPRSSLDKPALIQAIVGADVEGTVGVSGRARLGPPVLEVRRLARPPAVQDVSLTLHAGEVVGLAGLVGAGRSEVARLLFGADRATGGEMTLSGQAYRPRSPADAVRRGVALVPEERRSEGLLLDKSVAFNINLADLAPLRSGG
ncbi:sugar ABC transporter ATP-binding protein, partial [Deinococcus sp.]|uniref:sugar ABC transporter ATP-binding protein n=1 Tax=Deinococcus sp. TaxID=47478 RepID=UPI002869A193